MVSLSSRSLYYTTSWDSTKAGVGQLGSGRAGCVLRVLQYPQAHQALGYRIPAEVYADRAESVASTGAAATSADRSTGHSAMAELKLNLASELS